MYSDKLINFVDMETEKEENKCYFELNWIE